MDQQSLRAAGIAARRALSAEEREKRSKQICRHIIADTAFQRAETVLFYSAVREEVSLREAIRAARQQGKCCCFPICLDRGRMAALCPGEGGWRTGAFGIPEPDPERAREILPEQIDLILLPGTAFDRQGHRIGMGGGYYDRYLPRCTGAKRILAAFACQQAESFAPEIWDQPMDGVVTELGLQYFVQ